jgi:hypothetical protein
MAPDFFARRSDGSAVVIDCRPVERRTPWDMVKFDATAAACAVGGPVSISYENPTRAS